MVIAKILPVGGGGGLGEQCGEVRIASRGRLAAQAGGAHRLFLLLGPGEAAGAFGRGLLVADGGHHRAVDHRDERTASGPSR